MGVPTTVVVSTATSELMKSKIRAMDADLHVYGASWFEADEYMREELMARDSGEAVYCPPFEYAPVYGYTFSIHGLTQMY